MIDYAAGTDRTETAVKVQRFSRNARVMYRLARRKNGTVFATAARPAAEINIHSGDTEDSLSNSRISASGVSANKLRRIVLSTNSSHKSLPGIVRGCGKVETPGLGLKLGSLLKPLSFITSHNLSNRPSPANSSRGEYFTLHAEKGLSDEESASLLLAVQARCRHPAPLRFQRGVLGIKASLANAIKRSENDEPSSSKLADSHLKNTKTEWEDRKLAFQKYRLKRILSRLPVNHVDIQCLNNVSKNVVALCQKVADKARTKKVSDTDADGVDYAAKIFVNQKLSEKLLSLVAHVG